jgi:cobalt-zinc-cadmium efflux system outer membrane protein
MRLGSRTIALCVLACVCASPARAQDTPLTLQDVLIRARERAPQIVSARLAVDEARSRLAGARLRTPSDPEIAAGLGNRTGADMRWTDVDLGIGQAFEPSSRRAARIDGANAEIAASTADVDALTQTILHDAAATYYRALHAVARASLLDDAIGLASAVYTSADRRFRAGDIAVLDVNIARASLARLRAEREEADAVRTRSLGDLRQILGLEGDVAVAGSLETSGDVTDLNDALQAAAARPELRALEAAMAGAEATVRLGASFLKPDYGVTFRYSREEGDRILFGGMTITLPVFARGQEQRAAGSARAARLRADLAAARTRVRIEVRTAFEILQRRQTALHLLEADVLPGLEENVQLTTRSFDAGQIGLPELLVIRREILDTRAQYLDALLEAALAYIDFESSAGLLR